MSTISDDGVQRAPRKCGAEQVRHACMIDTPVWFFNANTVLDRAKVAAIGSAGGWSASAGAAPAVEAVPTSA